MFRQMRVRRPLTSSMRSSARRSFSSAPIFYKRNPVGSGGRSSQDGRVYTVFGASTGKLGRYLVYLLGMRGASVVVPYRGDDKEYDHLKTSCDVGKIAFVPFDLKDKNSIYECTRNADVVINLIGKDHETAHFTSFVPNYSFEDVHVVGARNIFEVANERANNVTRTIHVSALKTLDVPSGKTSSRWAKSKYEGELAVRSVDPNVTIVRPSTLFGTEDDLTNGPAQQAAMYNRVFLVDGGHVKRRPLWTMDLAEALVALLDDNSTAGKSYNFVGPEEWTYRDIVEHVLSVTKQGGGAKREEISAQTAELAATALQRLYILGRPPVTPDQITLLSEDDTYEVKTGEPKIEDFLNHPLTRLEDECPRWLQRYIAGGHFQELNLGDKA